ncbi:hypothetical protein NEOC65_001557 [Neochlamydia sp. AcF65]|uniref:hypothetical protein n=1 Tax=Neochlamydia sp. AcF65 TaxID=2795735 RepID=UPI001BC98CDF|nr:hypothetical protein [Neochlamydia sp. AcF65]MBS4166469.1 hypothetical protein [Neochlamydia sp. AcF65]
MQKILYKRNCKLPTNCIYHFCQEIYNLCLPDKEFLGRIYCTPLSFDRCRQLTYIQLTSHD